MAKKILFNFIFVLLLFSCFFIFGEITVRIYDFLAPFSIRNMDSIVRDPKLGWRSKPNFVFYKHMQDLSGKEYEVDVRTDKRGFRTFGVLSPSPNKKKVLFVGDSFTHAIHVSNGKTYYDLLNKRLPIEVFAYGALGYGMLQEYMIIALYAGTSPNIACSGADINDGNRQCVLNTKLNPKGLNK